MAASSVRPELEVSKKKAKKLPSLRQQIAGKIGKVISVIDHLQRSKVLSDAQLDFPIIVAIGPESCGKSSVLERLAHWSLFPQSEGICTRMPIELRLIHLDPEELRSFCIENKLPIQDGYCRMTLEKSDLLPGAAPEESSPFIALRFMQENVKRYHDKFVTRANGSLSGISSDRLVLEIRSSKVVNLRLIDLPGIISARHAGEHEDITQQTLKLTEKYLRQPHTLVLGVVSATEGFRTSTAMGLVQRFGKEKETVGVLTKADRAADLRPEARKDPMRELKAKLNGTSGDMISLPMGVVAIRNRDTNFDHDLSLDAIAERESTWFNQMMPGYEEKGKVGISALSEKLAILLLRYTINQWVPDALKKIETAISSKTSEMVSQCGNLPSNDPDDLMQIVSEAHRQWSRIRFFEPEVSWTESVLPSPACLQDGKPLASFLAWKTLKDSIFQSSELLSLFENWAQVISQLWEAPFVQKSGAGSSSSNIYLERFQILRTQLAMLLPVRCSKEAREFLMMRLDELCTYFDSRPNERDRFPSLARNLCRTVFYEFVFFPVLKSHGLDSQGIPTPAWICDWLTRLDDDRGLLEESEEWLAKRKPFLQSISNLQQAKLAIHEMVDNAEK